MVKEPRNEKLNKFKEKINNIIILSKMHKGFTNLGKYMLYQFCPFNVYVI